MKYDGHRSISVATHRRVHARPARVEPLAADVVYTVDADTFHWTRTGDEVVVTVMYANFLGAGPAQVVWPWTDEVEYAYLREECAAEDKRRILADVLAALRGG